VSKAGPIQTLVAGAARVALILALFGAGWTIYRRTTGYESAVLRGAGRSSETALRIVLRGVPDDGATQSEVPVQLYSIDVAAAQREFFSERRAGVRFEDFVTRRMGERRPISGRLDDGRQAIIPVPPGKWWVHVTLSGPYEVTWRLPVNVAGREQTVELTPENAYTRAKSF
jgi:hypothetical protein